MAKGDRGGAGFRFAAGLMLAASAGLAVELDQVDSWSDTFPATTSVWRVHVDSAEPVDLTWELAMGNVVADRGQRWLDASDSGSTVELPVRIPPLRETVAAKATLIVHAATDSDTARLVHPVWILPADPWSGLRGGLTGNPARVVDFDGRLGDVLRAANLEYVPVRNPAAIAALTNGLVVVGEGVSLRSHRGLAEALVRAAAGGTRIVLLAPADGTLPLPGHGSVVDLPRPAVRMEGVSALLDLDQRLDALSWPGVPSAVTSSFTLSAERRQPEVAWSAASDGWTWLELDFRATGGGCLLAVGWAPAGSWNAGPAPRHILATVMRHAMK